MTHTAETIRDIKGSFKWRIYQYFKNNWNDWRFYYLYFIDIILSRFYNENNGIYVMDEIWDNLIILDACRYDIFKELHKKTKINGKLEMRISRGSKTSEFLNENFRARKLSDVIYVSAMPGIRRFVGNSFFKIIDVWKEYWNEEYGTVLPEDVIIKALEIYHRYPDKRFIIHFLQPHTPFIGKYKLKGHFWQIALSKDRVNIMKAYRSNLRFVLTQVESLIENLEGVTVITSDHGEAFGERAKFFIPVFGHAKGIRIPSLMEVPWLIIKRPKTTKREKIKIRNIVSKLRSAGKI